MRFGNGGTNRREKHKRKLTLRDGAKVKEKQTVTSCSTLAIGLFYGVILD